MERLLPVFYRIDCNLDRQTGATALQCRRLWSLKFMEDWRAKGRNPPFDPSDKGVCICFDSAAGPALSWRSSSGLT